MMGKKQAKRNARVRVHRSKYTPTPHWSTEGQKMEYEAAKERRTNYYARKKT